MPLPVGWSDDGSRGIILLGETRKKNRKNPAKGKTENVDITLGHLEGLPLQGAGNKLHFKLRHFELANNFYVVPLAELEGKLYMSVTGKRKLLQLDRKSGKWKFRNLEDDRELLMYSHNGHIDYTREGAENSDDLEFGKLDTKDLSLHSRFVLKEKNCRLKGRAILHPFPPLNHTGVAWRCLRRVRTRRT